VWEYGEEQTDGQTDRHRYTDGRGQYNFGAATPHTKYNYIVDDRGTLPVTTCPKLRERGTAGS